MFKSRKRINAAWMRGLMFGRALGAKQERERIIELLEPLTDHMNCFQDPTGCIDYDCRAKNYEYAIKLIKGN